VGELARSLERDGSAHEPSGSDALGVVAPAALVAGTPRSDDAQAPSAADVPTSRPAATVTAENATPGTTVPRRAAAPVRTAEATAGNGDTVARRSPARPVPVVPTIAGRAGELALLRSMSTHHRPPTAVTTALLPRPTTDARPGSPDAAPLGAGRPAAPEPVPAALAPAPATRPGARFAPDPAAPARRSIVAAGPGVLATLLTPDDPDQRPGDVRPRSRGEAPTVRRSPAVARPVTSTTGRAELDTVVRTA
jgi:hypothetical protein